MVSTKEAIVVSHTQAPETLGAEENSFIHFLAENNEVFDRHSFLTYELRDEEAGQKNSPTLDSVVDKGIEVAAISYPQLSMVNSKKMRIVRRQIKGNFAKYIFGNSSEKDRLITSLYPFRVICTESS